MTLQNRAQGALLGLAVGDAIGTTVEFMPKDSFTPVDDMVGGGVFRLQKGQWTDDMSMALCLADSLIACGGFDAYDQMSRYLRWYRDGENSSTGRCFDIGGATRQALENFATTGESYAGSSDPQASGNGSLMRLAPVPIFYHNDLHETLQFAELSSKTTHASSDCLSACVYFAEVLHKALQGETDKAKLLKTRLTYPWSKAMLPVIQGDYQHKRRDEIFGAGYVVASLEASLWCFYMTDNFADAVLMATNLGDDADTTAAITGQLAGAYYGVDGIPEHWRNTVYWGEHIVSLADGLVGNKNPSTNG